MAYRNAEDTLESFGGGAMEQLAALAKPWWLGVSTHAGAPPGTSYTTLPARSIFRDIDEAAAELVQRYGKSFQGVSVEDYRSAAALLGKSF
jgi:hypothetical protein